MTGHTPMSQQSPIVTCSNRIECALLGTPQIRTEGVLITSLQFKTHSLEILNY